MDTPLEGEAPRKRSILDTVKTYAATMLGATRTKVDDFSAEVEYRTFRILWMAVWGVVGITSLWLFLMLACLTVIFGFHLPPRYAFGIPSLIFLLMSLVSLGMFMKTKRSRRKREHHRDDDR